LASFCFAWQAPILFFSAAAARANEMPKPTVPLGADTVSRSVGYWQQFSDGKTRLQTHNAGWIKAHLDMAELAAMSGQWILDNMPTSFLGDVAYLALFAADPAHQARASRAFERLVQCLFGAG